MVLSHFGADGIRAHLREGIRCGRKLEGLLRERGSDFEVPFDSGMGLVVFRVRGDRKCVKTRATVGGCDATRELAEFLKGQNFFLLPSVVEGRAVIRVAYGGMLTTEEHVDALFVSVVEFMARYEEV